MLAFIKTVHTVIFVIMATAVFYILYCGLLGRFDRLLYLALGLLSIESIVFVGNGMKCPLTKLAVKHGAEKGYVFDSFFPEKWTRYTFPVFGSVLVIGIVLVLARWALR
ncbi:MAG TPA: hypothetical protein VGK19_15835 [Capsulimonadaceae bacterium]|jgi:hypothetical protein